MKLSFWAGSSTSSSAEAGSPWKETPSLSTSSSRKTGFLAPACFMPWRIRPGIAPMYVRRWPRMSASSRAPPSEMRTYLRPIARAIDLAIEVLPTPGGPAKSRIRPRGAGGGVDVASSSGLRRRPAKPPARRPCVGLGFRLGLRSSRLRQLADGEKLQDPVLHVRQAVVVLVEDARGLAERPGARRCACSRAAPRPSRGTCG